MENSNNPQDNFMVRNREEFINGVVFYVREWFINKDIKRIAVFKSRNNWDGLNPEPIMNYNRHISADVLELRLF